MRVHTRGSKIALFAVLALFVSGLTPVGVASVAEAASAWTRVAGLDRYETAAAVSKAGFPAGASSAVVASGELFPDGLSASYVAGQVGGPVLLTSVSSIPAATLAELSRLHVATVYVAGGAAAVSTAVQDQLAALRAPGGSAVTVRRLAGADRYATAASIAAGFPKDSVGMVDGEKVALLASGTGFADALAGSAAAAGAHLPLLLTSPDRLSTQVLSTLQALGVSRVMVLGGTGSISAAAAKQLTDAGLGVTRLGGSDRVETATLIASWEISTLGFAGDQVAVARGDDAGVGVDALSVGAFIGRGKHPLLLAASPGALGGALLSWLKANTALTGGIVAGGPAAISDLLMQGLTGIVGGVTAPGTGGTVPGPVTTVLGPVTDVTVSVDSTSIALSWTNPTGTALTGVMIRRALGATPPATADLGTLVTDAAKPATSYTNTGLTSGTEYSYALFAHNGTPTYGSGAKVTTSTAAALTPGAVTTVTATQTSTSVKLAWINPADTSFTGVMIRRFEGGSAPSTQFAGALVFDVDRSTDTFTDTKLTPGKQYSYALFAHNVTPAYAAADTVTTTTDALPFPGPVTHVTATPSSTSVDLSWTNPADASFAGVRIVRLEGPTPPDSANVGTVVLSGAAPATISLTDTSVVSGTQYSYALFAYSATSVYAAPATVTSTTLASGG